MSKKLNKRNIVNVTVYTRNTCGPCRTLKYWLKQKEISFNEKNIDDNPKFVDELLKLTAFQMVPVAVIDGEVVMGNNIPKINQLLTQAA